MDKTKEFLKNWFGKDFVKYMKNNSLKEFERAMKEFEELDEMMKKFEELEETMEKIDYEGIPKELIKREETPYGTKIQIGPIVYGRKITKIGDNPPEIEEFSNIEAYKKLTESTEE